MIIPDIGAGSGTVVAMARNGLAADGTAQIEGCGAEPERLVASEIKRKE